MARTVVSGRCIVAAAGTEIRLGADAATTMTPTTVDGPISKLVIRAIETNTNAVVVGGSGVVAAAATRNGVALAPTQPPLVFEDIDDLGDIWVDAITSGEGICFLATVA
jgi:hypothetical protein